MQTLLIIILLWSLWEHKFTDVDFIEGTYKFLRVSTERHSAIVLFVRSKRNDFSVNKVTLLWALKEKNQWSSIAGHVLPCKTNKLKVGI